MNDKNWFEDPTGKHQLRYWDGKKWTEDVSDNGNQSKDPIESGSALESPSDLQGPPPAVTSESTPVYKSNWFIVLSLVLCFPVGLVFMWVYAAWPKLIKFIVTVVLLGLLMFGIFAPQPVESPTINLITDVENTESEKINVELKVKGPSGNVEVKIDDEIAELNGDTFSRIVELEEGDNEIKIVATREDKVATKSFIVYRYTAEEIAEKEAEATREKAEAEEAAEEQAAEEQAAADKQAAEEAAEEAARNAPKTSFGDGTWLVNTEIQPGTYRRSGGSFCYWERLSGTSGEFDDIIANGDETIITIDASDVAFNTDGCGNWTKQ